MRNIEFGFKSEILAKKYLLKAGYRLLEENYRTKTGEIDLIVTDKKGALIFVEVKARTSDKFGSPFEAVGYRKQSTIRRVAENYIAAHKLYDIQVRFDVIGILGEHIEHIENAF